jgi:ATP-dependent Clp protease adaptor protein ClpS
VDDEMKHILAMDGMLRLLVSSPQMNDDPEDPMGPSGPGGPRGPGGPGGPGGGGTNTGLITRTKAKTKKPSLYKVLLLNDDYTPMEFVVHILERFFNKNREEATQIMLHIHQRGVGVCGVYTFEVAETKVAQTIDFARKHQHPLQCTMEKE